jgi:Tol biopolymer transport system component
VVSGILASGRAQGRAITAGALALLLALATAMAAHAALDDTSLVSMASGADGEAGDDDVVGEVAVSNSGRYIAFASRAGNLNADAVPGVVNVYRRDRAANETILVSRATGGEAADADSLTPAISPGGRYIAFESDADNLSDEDNNGVTNVYLRDTLTGTTTLVSRADGPAGAAADGSSHNPSISLFGKHVAFDSDADNLASDLDPSVRNVFARSMADGAVKLVSRGNPVIGSPDGPAGDGDSANPSISSNGERIAFESAANNLSTVDDDSVTNVYLRNLRFRSTTALACTTGGFLQPCPEAGNGDSVNPAISLDGAFVAFESDAANLSGEDDDVSTDVFVRELSANATELVSRASGATGAGGIGHSFAPTVSGEGKGQFVLFASAAENLSADDVGTFDVFVRDTLNATTSLVSRASGLTGAGGTGSSVSPALSGDGRVAAFVSEADNLSAIGGGGVWSLFARELRLEPPPEPEPLPQGGHGGHGEEGGGHTEAGHDAGGSEHGAAGHGGTAGHGATGGHASHDSTKPKQTLFAPGRQDVDKLFVMVQVHERSTLRVTGSVSVPGASRAYRFKPVKLLVPLHGLRKVRLKLERRAIRTVKRTLRRGRTLRARVTATVTDAAGNRGVARRAIKLRP